MANKNAVRQAQAVADAHRQAQEQEEAEEAAAAAAEVANIVEFDKANVDDKERAQELGQQIKVEFSAADIKFWFAELEGEMLLAG